MSSITKHQDSIQIEMTGGTLRQPVYAKQGDRAARYVKVTLYDQDKLYAIPTDAIVSAYIKRPDDICIYVPCTYSGSTVTAELASNALAVAGMALCEIEVKSSDATEVLTSCTFKVRIEPNVKDLDAEPSEDQLTEIDVQLKKLADAESARVTAESKRVSAENARVSAENTRKTEETKRVTQYNKMSQYEQNFDSWFEKMKNQLSSDAAGKLQAEINGIWATETHTITTNSDDWTHTSFMDKDDWYDYNITLTHNFDPASITVMLIGSYGNVAPTDEEARAYGAPVCILGDDGTTLYFGKPSIPNIEFIIQISGKVKE